MEIEAPGDGFLAGVIAHEGAVIPVGETIAWLVAEGRETASSKSHNCSHGQGYYRHRRLKRSRTVCNECGRQRPVISSQISPKARRLAKELGVDFSGLSGTGPDGTITAEDVQAAADANKSGVTTIGRNCPIIIRSDISCDWK